MRFLFIGNPGVMVANGAFGRFNSKVVTEFLNLPRPELSLFSAN